jgi:hypothetical protein
MGGAAAAGEPVAAVTRAAAAVAVETWAAVSPPRATTDYSATRPGSARAPVSTELGTVRVLEIGVQEKVYGTQRSLKVR